jgi:hypothetical protein
LLATACRRRPSDDDSLVAEALARSAGEDTNEIVGAGMNVGL